MYGKFFYSLEKKSFFHIYFNDGKEDMKRNYFTEDDKVEKIKLIIDYQILSFNELFSNSNCIESICFKKFYRKNINNMNGMFHMCILLKEINFSNFNTDSVTDMCRMFLGCSSLKEINLSNFNTNKVTNMSYMFYGCLDELQLKIKSQFKNFK